MRDDQQAALVTLWSWSASEAHLQRPPSLQDLLCSPDQDHPVEKVLCALQCTPGKPADQSPLAARKSPASPATPSQPPEAHAAAEMASEASDGEARAIRRSRSWNRGREVTWDEMRSLGLHKALNEYYKMTSPKPSCMGRPRKAAGPGMLYTLLCATALRPVPCFLTPEALSAAAGWAAYLLALVLYHTAPLTLPLALWLALSSATGGAQLQLPAAAIRALPALGALRVPHGALPPRAVLAGVLLFVAALRVAERAVQRAASRRAACEARALRPEQVEAYYAGWELPESVAPGQGGRAAEEEREDVLQRLVREAVSVCEGVYGSGSCPRDLDSYDDVASLVLKLCNDAGVSTSGPSQRSPEELLELLLRAKQAIGLQ